MITIDSPIGKFARLLIAAIAVAVLAACGEGGSGGSSTPQGSSGSGPTPAPLLLTPAPGSIYLGVYDNPQDLKPAPPSELDAFEQLVGRQFALSNHYYGFYDSFPGAYESDDLANGRIPVDSWDCQPSNAAIASGADDNAIRTRADAIKAWGHPIFLRYMWEMNLASKGVFRGVCYDPKTDLPNGFFSPQEFIAAWKRIRMIFAQEGVTNVVWVWNPSGVSNPAAYYPGAAQTDWVAFDRYDTGDVPFDQAYATAYTWLAIYGKPILVSETGVPADTQITYFQSAASDLQTEFPQIKGFVYFDATNPTVNQFDWRIAPASFGAFQQMALTPYMSAMPTL